MKYYAAPVFTFVEEQQMITIIKSFGGADLLECNCDYCGSPNKFLESSYAPTELDERHHFYDRVLTLRDMLVGMNQSERNAMYKEYLDRATTLATRIHTDSAGVVSAEIVPSYVGLKALIDD
jgi:hypothetical protein